MRKKLLLALSLLLSMASFAQVQFGVKGGLSLANVAGIGSDNNQARLGFYAGGLVRIALEQNLYLQPELLYALKGYRVPATQYTAEATAGFSYVNMPVLFGYKPGRNLMVLFGPEAGLMTTAKSKSSGIETDLYAFYRHFDLGLDLGFAYSIKKGLGLELRYNFGFSDLANVVYTDTNGNIIAQAKAGANRVLQAGIYYLIPE
jgi:hypothetical protein